MLSEETICKDSRNSWGTGRPKGDCNSPQSAGSDTGATEVVAARTGGDHSETDSTAKDTRIANLATDRSLYNRTQLIFPEFCNSYCTGSR